MPRYVIERDTPGAGQLSPAELRVISQTSNGIIRELGGGLTWLHSYVADDKIYCIYDAPSPDLVIEHARCMGIPVTRISELHAIISPTTADE